MPKEEVIVIPAKPQTRTKPKRIAAYCRVSTQAEEQNHSLMAQISYYKKLIGDDSDCELVGIYADNGISGTKAINRVEFQRLIEDCRAGKIDAVYTKSVSRFCRNTVETLMYTRELRALGIDVFFEKENLHTCSSEGELLLTLMAAVAETEAVSMSDNIKWGKRHQYKKGLVESMTISTLLGYTQEKGIVTIVEEEAEIVRMIYDYFLTGHNYEYISEQLRNAGIKTKRVGARWASKTIINILSNEKYCGDCLFQKTFISDPIEHTKALNKGELPQYFVEDAIPAIIAKDKWLAVQELRKRHSGRGLRQSERYPFTNMLVCPFCGKRYKHFTVHGHNRQLNTWYRCGSYKDCSGIPVPGMTYTNPDRTRIKNPSPEMIAYREKYNHPTPPRPMLCTDVRITIEQPQKAFVQAWNLIVAKKARTKATLQRTAETAENPLTRYRAKEMDELLDTVGRITEFDYPLMLRTLDYIEVQPNGRLTFVFQSGIRLTV